MIAAGPADAKMPDARPVPAGLVERPDGKKEEGEPWLKKPAQQQQHRAPLTARQPNGQIVQSVLLAIVQIVPRETAHRVDPADVAPADVVLVGPAALADGSSSAARRSASSAWKRSIPSTTAMCACCSSSSPSAARSFPAA